MDTPAAAASVSSTATDVAGERAATAASSAAVVVYLLTIWVEGDLAHGPGLIEPTNNILNLNTFEYLSKFFAFYIFVHVCG
jgi:hypothetical protein